MDCANKEMLAGTDLCDGRASYCHKCVEHSNMVCQAQNEILRNKLEAALLQISEFRKAWADLSTIAGGMYQAQSIETARGIYEQWRDSVAAVAFIEHNIMRSPIKPKSERALCGEWVMGVGPCVAYIPCEAHAKKRKDEPPNDDPKPIGVCKRCQAPVYTEEGFCGACGPGRA